jgi:hypothetical protein
VLGQDSSRLGGSFASLARGFGRGLLAVVELNAMGAGARKASLLGNSAKPHTMKLLSPSLTENSASLGERGEPVRSMTLGDSLRI